MRRTVHSIPEIEPLTAHVRPATIWLGIACFFVGAIGAGASLAAARFGGTAPDPAAGLALLSFGVAYVGIGFAMTPTGSPYDPEIDLPNWQRILMAALSGPFLAAGLLVLFAAVG